MPVGLKMLSAQSTLTSVLLPVLLLFDAHRLSALPRALLAHTETRNHRKPAKTQNDQHE